MSGEFENLPKKGADEVPQEATHEQAHDPFLEERSLKAPEKTEEKKVDDKGELKKEAFREGSGESYSDFLARTNTPQQNYEALRKHLESCCSKIAQLQESGFDAAQSDVTAGGSFLAGVVRDNTPDGVKKFLESIGDAINPRSEK